ncbi:MAG: hypothetical protein FJ088_02455, partial [Deltaproteobacteria bacterium]|nr:hypothetical protein [Deltaproteobacteria bacterium]
MVMHNPEYPRTGGKRTIRHFTGLLGLNERDEYRVESVKRVKDRFEVVVKGAGGEDVTLVIESFAGDKPSFVATGNLALSYKGSSIPSDFAAALKKDAFSGLRDASIDTLSDVLENDPDTISEKGAEVQKISVKKALPVSKEIRVIPEKDEYADFFGREELICRKALALWLFNPCTAILHFDSECIPPPNFGNYMISTTNTPWDNKIRDRGRPRQAAKRYSEPDPDGFIAFTTDLREKDVILGSLQKEKDIFEYVFSRREAQPKIFFQGCVSVVSGTDTQSLFKKYKDKGTSLALYFRGGENVFVKNIFREITVDLRLQGKTDSGKKPNLVNIIGLSDRLTPDLLEQLGALGVEINTVLIPQVSADAAKIENAALNVFAPNMFYQDIYDQIRIDTSVKEIEIDAPYGFEGTRRWFEEIAARTGLEGNLK